MTAFLPQTLRRLAALLRAPAAEADPAFAALVTVQTRLGMRLAGWLGVVGVALFVGLQLLAGQRPALSYGPDPAGVVVVTDDLLVFALSLAMLVMARRPAYVRRGGRATLAAVLVVASAAIAVDDAARGDLVFTVSWLALVLLVGVGAVPFQPRQAFGMWAVLAALYGALAARGGMDFGSEGAARPTAYLVLMGAILTSISARLYAARHGQFVALREAEALRARLAEQERRRIADDLHDGLASRVSALALRLDLAAHAADDAEARDALAGLAASARRVTADLRDTIWLVDAQADTAADLLGRFETVAYELLPGARIAVGARGPLPDAPVPGEIRRAAMLAVREALHNAARHAAPTTVEVALAVDGRTLAVTVADDGCGFDAGAARPGRGLASMTRRLAAHGGSARVESAPGRGTRVVFTFPLGEA